MKIKLLALNAGLMIIASACTPSTPLPFTETPGPTPTRSEPSSTETGVPEQIQQPDVIYHNANILTMDPRQPTASALAIGGDIIAAVGSDEEILALAGSSTTVVNLQGLTITPGFIDSHEHRITQRHKWGFSTVAEAVQEALSMGWTSLVELAVDENQLNEMIAADAAGELGARVNVYLIVNTFSGEPLGDWYQAYQPNQQFSPYLRIAGLKIFIDFDSGRTLLWDQDELNEFIRQRQAEGWQITVKAIGVQSHELALNAYEYALDGENNDGFRHRIEHSTAANDAQIARMADQGIIASIQPSFPAAIWYMEDIRNLVVEEGLNSMFRWRDYMNAGVVMTASTFNPQIPFGSSETDEFYDPSHFSPMGVLYRSNTQIGLGGAMPEAWMLERALTVSDLLPMLTINGAYATSEENEKGSLAPGNWADLVILSANPLAVPQDDILGIQVLMTMVGGHASYCADGQDVLCLRPEQARPPDFTPAQGNWVATDTDGSSMSMQAIQNVDGSFSISALDEDSSYCRRELNTDESIEVVWEGRGTAEGYTLNLNSMTALCVGTEVTLLFDMGLTYDPTADTLLDSFGVEWHRE
jgi:predicted amidohydrolase YtcJ